jgi:transcriptional regulator GlxA family with amidase domain
MTSALLHVDVFVFSGAMAGVSLSVIDMLRIANMVAQLQQGASATPVRWQLLNGRGAPISSANRMFGAYVQQPTGAETNPASHHVCFVPPLHGQNIPAVRAQVKALPSVQACVQAHLAHGHTVATVSSGAWFVGEGAQTGGIKMALPWYFLSGFCRDFPGVPLCTEYDWVADGALITGALPSSVTSVVLAMLRNALPEELVQACERLLVHQKERSAMTLQTVQEQHIRATRDSAVARAVAWLDQHLEQTYSLDAVASAAAVSPRTILRHFQQVMGMSPLDYLHAQRVKRARILLEVTLNDIPTVAHACGYADPAAFRRIFMRLEKQTPIAYRTANALRSSRMRWKVEGLGP